MKRRDTAAEMIVRRLLHKMGYRYRLHVRDLPGTPDIVLPRLRAIVLVNGCFWHGHEACKRAKLPESNQKVWTEKIQVTRERDFRVAQILVRSGWRVFVVWECETRDEAAVTSRLKSFLANELRPAPSE